VDDNPGNAARHRPVALVWLLAVIRAVWLLVVGVLVVVTGLYCALQVFVVALLRESWIAPSCLGLGLVAAFLLAVLVHEMGHVLGASAGRLHIETIKVGPLWLAREGSNWRLRLAPRSHRLAGYVFAYPIDNHRILGRHAVMAAAGPAASFLAALLFLLLATWSEPLAPALLIPSFREPWRSLLPGSVLAGLWHMAFAINLVFALVNAVPFRSKTETTDGAVVLACLCGKTWILRTQAVLALCHALQRGVRPRDWNEELVARLAGDEDGSAIEALAALYAYYHAIDRRQTEEARRWLSRATFGRGEPGAPRDGIDIEVAYFVGFHQGDPLKARVNLERVNRSKVEEQTWLRGEAAVLGAEGKIAEALASVDAGLTAVGRSTDPGGSLAERDWLEEMRQHYLSLG
jgi:hypothetical protein